MTDIGVKVSMVYVGVQNQKVRGSGTLVGYAVRMPMPTHWAACARP